MKIQILMTIMNQIPLLHIFTLFQQLPTPYMNDLPRKKKYIFVSNFANNQVSGLEIRNQK